VSAALVQGVLIALVVAWSALFALHRLLPATSRRLWARLAAALDRPPVPAGLRRLARSWQPRGSSGAACGDGCSACGGCASAAPRPAVAAQPLQFRPRPKA